MSRLIILFICVLSLSGRSEVKISEVKKQKSLVAYSIKTKYYKVFLVNPAKYNHAKYSENSLRGGWFKNFLIKNASNGIMGSGESIFGDFRFGLTQAFEPEIELRKGMTEAVLPGIGIAKVKNNKIDRVKKFFPWTFSFRYKDNKGIVSFSQNYSDKKAETVYKLRIDCIFSDSAEIIVKGVFLNNGKSEIRGGICPLPIFKRGLEKTEWISIPHVRSKLVKKKRWQYIDTSPLSVDRMHDYYEFYSERLSKAKRWIAAGGLQDKELMVFKANRPLNKVIFWKTPHFFSISPMVNIKVAPVKRLEWQWKYLFGRGLDRVDAVLKNGLMSCQISPLSSKSKYFKGLLNFLPYKEMEDVSIDATFKNHRRRIISTGTYTMLTMSPLCPGYANLKLNKRFRSGNRYIMKVEVFVDDLPVESKDEVLYP